MHNVACIMYSKDLIIIFARYHHMKFITNKYFQNIIQFFQNLIPRAVKKQTICFFGEILAEFINFQKYFFGINFICSLLAEIAHL